MNPVTPITPKRTENVTFRYKDVANKTLHEALDKLDQFTGWADPKDIHRFNKLKQTFEREEKKAGHYYKKLIDRHAIMETAKRKNKDTGAMEEIKGRDGKPIQKPKWQPNESGAMDIAFKDLAAFEKDQNVFHAHEFVIKVFQFDSDDLVKAGLTPAEIRACARLMNGADVELYEDIDAEILDDDVPEDLRDVIFPQEVLNGSNPATGTDDQCSERSSGADATSPPDVVHAARRPGESEAAGRDDHQSHSQGH